MSIHIAGKRIGMFGFFCFSHWVPKVRGPPSKGIGEAFGSIGTGDLRQKGFGIAIPIGVRSPGEERQAVGGIAAQIPGAL